MGRTRETKRTRLCPRAGRGEPKPPGPKGDLGGGQGTAARRDKRRNGRQNAWGGDRKKGESPTLGPRGRPDPGESKGGGDPPPTARGALGTPSPPGGVDPSTPRKIRSLSGRPARADRERPGTRMVQRTPPPSERTRGGPPPFPSPARGGGGRAKIKINPTPWDLSRPRPP